MTADVAATASGSDDLDRLVRAAGDGDRRALGQVLHILRPVVLRYCRGRLGRADPAAAEDVAQEVLLAVLHALPGYRDQGRSFLAFVHGIAAHKTADAFRRRSRALPPAEPGTEEPDPRPGPEDVALRRDAARHADRLLDLLPARQREIVVLRVALGLSAEETAEAVGSTPGAVRVAQHRAMRRLRAAWALDDEEGRSDWDAAPRTGDPVLDALLADAGAALDELGGAGGAGGTGGARTGTSR